MSYRLGMRCSSIVARVGMLVTPIVAAGCSSEDPSLIGGGASSGAASGSGGLAGDGGAEGGSTAGTDGGPGPGKDGGTPSTGSSKPNCKYTAHKTGLTQLQQAGGLSFNVYAPTSYDPAVGHTVVVLMHGQDSNGVPELTALWKPIADDPTQQLVLVAPKGSRASTTAGDTTGANWATSDLDKVLALMTEIDDCYDVFPKKHILWGFSEGCFYGYLLGIGAADSFSGLAMGGANTSFARSSGYQPSSATWKIPVSHVHGTMDQNLISLTYQDKADFIAAGHVFTLHEHPGGHTISAAQVRMQYDDLAASTSP